MKNSNFNTLHSRQSSLLRPRRRQHRHLASWYSLWALMFRCCYVYTRIDIAVPSPEGDRGTASVLRKEFVPQRRQSQPARSNARQRPPTPTRTVCTRPCSGLGQLSRQVECCHHAPLGLPGHLAPRLYIPSFLGLGGCMDRSPSATPVNPALGGVLENPTHPHRLCFRIPCSLPAQT